MGRKKHEQGAGRVGEEHGQGAGSVGEKKSVKGKRNLSLLLREKRLAKTEENQ